jgi:hypothetical protein
MSSNDEVERRGASPASNEGTLSQSSTPPWLTEDATRDRSNRLLDGAPGSRLMIGIIGAI